MSAWKHLASWLALFHNTMMTDTSGIADDTAPVSDVVTVLLPVLNESANIREVLERLLRQSVSVGQVVIADGGSTDATREVIAETVGEDARFELIDNPGRLQSAGLNLGLARASGDVILRLDGHSLIESDYVERCVSTLRCTGADVVGGRMSPLAGGDRWSPAVARAMQRWWGAGPADFHGRSSSGWSDTVYLGAFRREAILRAGGWSETVGVNEDYELNYRIRQAGGRVWYEADLRVGYVPRHSVRALGRQYFRYGRSKATMLRQHPGSLRPRQAVPAGLVPGATLVFSRRFRRAVLAGVGVHVVTLAWLAGRERTLPVPDRTRAAIAAITMHWSWSAGFCAGVLRPFARAGAR